MTSVLATIVCHWLENYLFCPLMCSVCWQHSDSSESDLEEDDKIESRSKAWGKRRDDFYGADVSTKVDLGVSSGDEEAGKSLHF